MPREGRRKRELNARFSTYIFRVLKQVHPDLGITGKAMKVMNDFMIDTFNRLTSEAAALVKHSKKVTLTSTEVQTATRLVLPGELSKHAVNEATKAIANFTRSRSRVPKRDIVGTSRFVAAEEGETSSPVPDVNNNTQEGPANIMEEVRIYDLTRKYECVVQLVECQAKKNGPLNLATKRFAGREEDDESSSPPGNKIQKVVQLLKKKRQQECEAGQEESPERSITSLSDARKSPSPLERGVRAAGEPPQEACSTSAQPVANIWKPVQHWERNRSAEPAQTAEAIEAAEPMGATVVANSSQVTQSSDSADVRPSDERVAEKVVQQWKPVQPWGPLDSWEPVRSTQVAAKAADLTPLWKPAQPWEHSDTWEPVRPVENVRLSVDPAASARTIQAASPVEIVERIEPSDSVQPIGPVEPTTADIVVAAVGQVEEAAIVAIDAPQTGQCGQLADSVCGVAGVTDNPLAVVTNTTGAEEDGGSVVREAMETMNADPCKVGESSAVLKGGSAGAKIVEEDNIRHELELFLSTAAGTDCPEAGAAAVPIPLATGDVGDAVEVAPLSEDCAAKDLLQLMDDAAETVASMGCDKVADVVGEKQIVATAASG